MRFARHGGCPKNRSIDTPDGEPGLNYLCAECKHSFNHIDPSMQVMCDLLRQNRPPSDLGVELAARDAARYADVGRNEPCPCGSGKKFKRCHGGELSQA